MKPLSKELLRKLPKVLLHDHLDGGLRPTTIIDLAKEQKYTKLPTINPRELDLWFQRGAQRGSLPLFLEGFEHTCALMQNEEAIERIAYETVEDMFKDGVVYFETRFAPILLINKGLTPPKILRAVIKGLQKGKKDFGVEFGVIICGMRNMEPSISLEMAELAVDFRNQGVVGFDLAGEEGGYPPKKHVEAFHFIQRENFNITIHAGEAFGKESIWQALQWCGAHRIGHGTRIIEDMKVKNGEVISMGTLSQFILDKRIPIEICLTSNVHTGAVKNIDEHPFEILYKYKFRLSLNTDDRLMSGITLTDEYEVANKKFNLGLKDLEKLTINAMKSAFIPYKDRIRIIYDIIKPEYQKAAKKLS